MDELLPFRCIKGDGRSLTGGSGIIGGGGGAARAPIS